MKQVDPELQKQSQVISLTTGAICMLSSTGSPHSRSSQPRNLCTRLQCS